METLQQMLTTHYAGINSGDLDTALSVFAPDVEVVTPNGAMQGVQAQRMLGEAFKVAAPDARIEARTTIVAGDTIVVEGVYSGTHTGPLVGPGGEIPATGKQFSFAYCDVLRERDGRFVSHHIYWDNATFLGQLGVIPA